MKKRDLSVMLILKEIVGEGCHCYTKGTCWENGRDPLAPYESERVCDSCLAEAAIEILQASPEESVVDAPPHLRREEEEAPWPNMKPLWTWAREEPKWEPTEWLSKILARNGRLEYEIEQKILALKEVQAERDRLKVQADEMMGEIKYLNQVITSYENAGGVELMVEAIKQVAEEDFP